MLQPVTNWGLISPSSTATAVLAGCASRASASASSTSAGSRVRVRTTTTSTLSTSSLPKSSSVSRPSAAAEPAAPASTGFAVPVVPETCSASRQDAESSGVADDSHPATGRQRLLREEECGLGEVLGVGASDHPSLGEE